ncbi:hypothetical protein [Deinococcus ruber]|uniref:Copper amine oxidase-like N-terminal domain-containing protein n=1 Tax=Deinococcus ruber TaxID=1848197 RepID=A0A918CP81_9DEIO|nr:hypothetical protein [Deinococcus ruber]GGR33493.1 hypothetical protein GCM10008957_49730 [Deinococcus ruber]
MKKIALMAVLLSSSLVLAAPTFRIAGSAVKPPSVQQGGKVYVDAAFAKALGYALTFGKATHTSVLTARTPNGPTRNGPLAGAPDT